MDYHQIIKQLVEQYCWDAVENALCEAAEIAPDDCLDELTDLMDAAILFGETENWELAERLGKPIVYH